MVTSYLENKHTTFERPYLEIFSKNLTGFLIPKIRSWIAPENVREFSRQLIEKYLGIAPALCACLFMTWMNMRYWEDPRELAIITVHSPILRKNDHYTLSQYPFCIKRWSMKVIHPSFSLTVSEVKFKTSLDSIFFFWEACLLTVWKMPHYKNFDRLIGRLLQDLV